jgi:hypothetical protein
MCQKAKGFSLNHGYASHLKFADYVAVLLAQSQDLYSFYNTIPNTDLREKILKLAVARQRVMDARCIEHEERDQAGQPTRNLLPGARAAVTLFVPSPRFDRTLHPTPSVQINSEAVKMCQVYFTKRRIEPSVRTLFNLPHIVFGSVPFGFSADPTSNDNDDIDMVDADEPQIFSLAKPIPRYIVEPTRPMDRLEYNTMLSVDRKAANAAIDDAPLDELIALLQADTDE